MPAGRFAPSPSGPLHLGNLRTALLAWLFARSDGSGFLVRIEDLDPQRSRPEHERAQLDDLRAIGIDWDGEPVRQSERTPLYRDALARLEADGRVYPCWCTRAEIQAAAEAPHGPLPEGAYPGTCRRLTAAQRADRARGAGRPPSLRLAADRETTADREIAADRETETLPSGERIAAHPSEENVSALRIAFEDRLHGRVEGAVDDFVLWRWDDTPAYNLAVVVDDAEQGVGEVVRGDDLLDSTLRQLLLYRLLDRPAPAHAHVPLVLGPDGARLAKRHGAVTLADRVALGETPTDALSWMASSVGLTEPGERVSAPELVDRFDPAALTRQPTVFG
ncbi:MAG TPA: tRNA glutamyl-Q(34) synthetase GluQRS [Thermoleophilaceae bacterium]|nr:tRNA glutamyl-Q(34) synthetase GluQRS [Thermoleophilaceae bacterium]